MNVLALFDGMSCGRIAMERAGLPVGTYYASEIDRHAMKVAQANYPDTVQLGDVTRWREWPIDWASIDLVLAGSPCQGFSFAGKQLAFDDPRSALFFVFVEIWQHVKSHNPAALFLLENVRMKKEHQAVISRYMGVEPIAINSNLVSAQNRYRLYWTNIASEPYGLFGDMRCGILQPADRGILLRDILEGDVADKYYLSEKKIAWFKDYTKKMKAKGNSFRFSPTKGLGEAKCVTAGCPKRGLCDNYIIHSLQPRNGKGQGGKGHLCKSDNKSYCVDTGNGQAVELQNHRIRRLTPTECERLQTAPDGYTAHVSDTQRYRMLGNGWTIDVISFILSHINK